MNGKGQTYQMLTVVQVWKHPLEEGFEVRWAPFRHRGLGLKKSYHIDAEDVPEFCQAQIANALIEFEQHQKKPSKAKRGSPGVRR